MKRNAISRGLIHMLFPYSLSYMHLLIALEKEYKKYKFKLKLLTLNLLFVFSNVWMEMIYRITTKNDSHTIFFIRCPKKMTKRQRLSLFSTEIWMIVGVNVFNQRLIKLFLQDNNKMIQLLLIQLLKYGLTNAIVLFFFFSPKEKKLK